MLLPGASIKNFIADHMTKHIALIVDAAARSAWVCVEATDWDAAVGILEDHGCEVVEDHSDDYDEEDIETTASLNAAGVITIHQLLEDSDFIPNQ